MSITGDTPEGGRPTRPDRTRPPVTIDLEATHESDETAGSESPEEQLKPGVSRRWPYASSPVIVGAISAVLIVILVLIIGLTRNPGSDDPALTSLRRDVDQLKGEVARMTAGSPSADRVEARLADLDQRIAALTAKMAQPPVPDPSVTGSLQDLNRRLGALDAAPRVNPADFAELQRRVEALQRRVDPPSVAPRVDLPGAIDGLKAAAARGRPFADEAALVRSLGGDAGVLDAIAPFAAKGVPGKDQLAEEFPSIADAILRATAPEAADGGIIGRLGERARSLVTVRPSAPMAGSSAEAIVSRMLGGAKEGDIAAVLGEWKGLPEAGRTASQAWVRSAEARLELDRRLATLASQGRAP